MTNSTHRGIKYTVDANGDVKVINPLKVDKCGDVK